MSGKVQDTITNTAL